MEIDLGAPHAISSIRLTVAQSPAGSTEHLVYGRGPGENDPLLLLDTLVGFTSSGQDISLTPEQPWRAIQSLRIETTKSPSWVAWMDIRIVTAIEESPLN